MKRSIVATIILLCCIISALTVNLALEKKTERLYTLAQSALKNPSDFYEFESEWEKQRLFFSLFTDHNNFEEIDKQIVKAKHLDGELYRDACIEITTEFSLIKKQFSYSFSNVF